MGRVCQMEEEDQRIVQTRVWFVVVGQGAGV